MLARAVRTLTDWLTALGERFGQDWLVYNPLQMRRYHKMSVAHAPAFMRILEETFPGATRWVDVGSGTGALQGEAVRRGLSVIGCEHSPFGRMFARWRGLDTRPFDLSRRPPARLKGPFDLAYCIEVAEHVPPDLGDTLVGFTASLAPMIVFTAAHPGQGGLGHINEQPQRYWIERFENEGARYDLALSTALANALRNDGVAEWLTSNLMVFRGHGQEPAAQR